MYRKQMLEIGRVENGYVIECRVPIKVDMKKKSSEVVAEYPGSCEKEFIATSMDDAFDIVKKIMPLLDTEFTSEEQFDKAFNKAAGVMDEEA